MDSNRTGWGLLAPTLIILGVMGLLPFLYVLYISFFDWNVFSASGQMEWAGVNNFRRLVFDSAFLGSLGRTLLFTLLAVTSELILGFLLASTLLRDFPGKIVFRTIHALPLVIAPIAVGATWRLLTIPGFGLAPYYLDRWFDIDYNIGRYAEQAFFTTLAMDIWHWTPFVTLTMLAGLTAMPKEPQEQARVDGANRWQVLRFLTIPMMMPVIVTTVFIRMMDALRIVDEVFMLTGGGPGNATRYVGIYIWRVVFPQTDYGYGSAMSLLVLYFTIVLAWLLFVALAQVGNQQSSS
ncbi:MAG: sugar ABC transporter permease [Caldilineaceae bacterium]|nr:sugar ABC transporter permease [Caldilineaceae bacterium]MCB9138611.1 sugar ABC transporter permease [Caldilineaceae bacterium]